MNLFQFAEKNRFKKMIVAAGLSVLALITLSLALPGMSGAVPGSDSCDIKQHDISIAIQPADHTIRAVDRIKLETTGAGRQVLFLGAGLKIEKLLLDGKKIPVKMMTPQEFIGFIRTNEIDEEFSVGAAAFYIQLEGSGEHSLEVRYRGVVYDTLKVPEYSRGTLAEETTGIVGEEGVFLSPETHWYPDQPDDYAYFSFQVSTPDEFEALTEGRLTGRTEKDGQIETSWDVDYPTRGVYLVAGNYILREIESEGVRVIAYFFPSEEDLIDSYLQASARYISMYNKLIGPYPFSKFAIVENFFPTGYGMPSYTLLGRRVIRLPFIIHTSLGHEVAHNWWGNGVYVDYDQGNWCEGLTAYFADYRYKEARSDSAAADYRRTINVDYTSYVNEENEFPLSEFTERTTPASRTIGYGKSAMVFHMLRRQLGDEAFYRGLRRFYRDFRFQEASWADIESVFEQVSGRHLDRYFEQWVRGRGAPTLTLAEPVVETRPDGYRVTVRLEQDPVFDLTVPVVFSGDHQSNHQNVELSSAGQEFSFALDFNPRAVTVDPGHDVFRRLSSQEIPSTISGALGDEQAVIVLPTGGDAETREVFESLAQQLGKTGKGRVIDDAQVTAEDLSGGAVIVLGGPAENSVYQQIELPADINLAKDHISVGGIGYAEPGHSTFITFPNPLNSAASVCIIAGNSVESIRQSGYKIIHYGKYSYVTFNNGKRLKAGVFPVTENPLRRVIQEKAE